jgi:hypothetical protein
MDEEYRLAWGVVAKLIFVGLVTLFLTIATVWIVWYVAKALEPVRHLRFFLTFIVVIIPFVILIYFGSAIIIYDEITAPPWPTALPLKKSPPYYLAPSYLHRPNSVAMVTLAQTVIRQRAILRRGVKDRGEYRETAGAGAEGLTAIRLGETDAVLLGVTAVEKHELSKIDFELIEDAFKALLQSRPDPVTADKIADLRDKFRDAFTGWLEIEEAA